MAQRGAQVMGDGVGECFEFRIGGQQLGGAGADALLEQRTPRFHLALRQLSLGDVVEQDERGWLAVPFDFDGAHFGGARGAAGERDIDFHRAGLDDEAGRLAHQVGGRAAVHLLGPAVDKAHRAGTVEDQDDVGAGLDDVAQGGPVLLQAGGAQLEFRAHAVAFDSEVDRASQQRPDAGTLDQIILGPAAQRPQRGLVVVRSAINDQGHFGHGGADAFEGLHAAPIGAVEVEQNGVELAAGKQAQAIQETGSHSEMGVNQNFAAELGIEQPGAARIVFEDQDFHPAPRCSQGLVVVHGAGLPRLCFAIHRRPSGGAGP